MQSRLEYTWNTGSIPPPDYYEYKIVIDPKTEAEISMYPDYPESDPPRWIATFTVPDETLEILHSSIDKLPPCPPGEVVYVGGGRAELTLFPPGKEPQTICLKTDEGHRLAGSIRALVPDSIWKTLLEKLSSYRTRH